LIVQRVLILCTANSARSQMAEGLLRRLAGRRFEVHSAGTKPGSVRGEAVKAMAEVGIDLSGHRSKSVDEYAEQPFDYVITVCDNAKESCPVFPQATERLHWPFDDPAAVDGPEDTRLAAFRRVREQIATRLTEFAGGVQLRPASLYDHDGVTRLLTVAGLPPIDEAAQFGPQYVVAEVSGTIVGAAGV
jgi:arsenate reductase (thioredoxin)